jgi:hypothetical protein
MMAGLSTVWIYRCFEEFMNGATRKQHDQTAMLFLRGFLMNLLRSIKIVRKQEG